MCFVLRTGKTKFFMADKTVLALVSADSRPIHTRIVQEELY
jgi:hypothetical protein